MDVEDGRDVAADPGAILQGHPATFRLPRHLAIDDDADDGAAPLALVAHVHELDAVRAAHGIDQCNEEVS